MLITPKVIHGITHAFLAPRYDNFQKSPQFHWDMWDDCCSEDRYVADAAPRGFAKCLDGETLVSMADGSRKRIADLLVGDRVVSCSEGKLVTSRVSRHWDSGEKECLAIRTRSGRVVLATAEHRFLGFDGWLTVGELKAGDYLASPRQLPLVESEDRLDEEVRLIALEPLAEWVAAEQADVFWDRVESVSPVGLRPTHDIEVWGTHSFIADGIVSHNSTAVTHAYTLAMTLLRQRDFVLIVSDTETQAIEFLGDIKTELLENEGLRETFKIRKLLKDTENNVIVRLADGYSFRLLAKGSEQKVRGLKWQGRRPNLIVGDDLENDESVANPDRREKFRKWILNALLPCGSDDCLYRFVGTILHMDSWLNRVLADPKWRTRKFVAHNADFSELLWPEKFPRERLESILQLYINQGNLSGYFQEYLNNPIDEGNAFFRKQDFIPMDSVDRLSPKNYVAAADFAISEKERSDFTVIMVAGIDENGLIHIVDVRRGRWDSLEIIDELFSVQKRYDIEIFTFETEKIDKALGPFINARMIQSGTYLNIHKITPSQSKLLRGRSISAKMKSGAVRFDCNADWYPALESELMSMTNSGSKGQHDDSFDAFAYIGMTIEQYRQAASPAEKDEFDYWNAVEEAHMDDRSLVTGY